MKHTKVQVDLLVESLLEGSDRFPYEPSKVITLSHMKSEGDEMRFFAYYRFHFAQASLEKLNFSPDQACTTGGFSKVPTTLGDLVSKFDGAYASFQNQEFVVSTPDKLREFQEAYSEYIGSVGSRSKSHLDRSGASEVDLIEYEVYDDNLSLSPQDLIEDGVLEMTKEQANKKLKKDGVSLRDLMAEATSAGLRQFSGTRYFVGNGSAYILLSGVEGKQWLSTRYD